MQRLDVRLAIVARLAVACAFAAAVFLGVTEARAYPWMIRHGYTGCAMCHADPAGGGVLTEYGRAQSDLLLITHYRAVAEDAEPAKSSGFLFGAVEPPEWLMLGGSLRAAVMRNSVSGLPPTQRFVQMESDLRAFVRAGPLRSAATLGWLHEGGRAAQVTQRASDNLIARQYWVGLAFADDAWLVRAGRMNLPFGIRNVEHTLWVRSSTRTDINDAQQHGVSIAFNGEKLRAELMGIAGNFQMAPDEYRERGWVGFVERAIGDRWAVGVSTLGTWALRDRLTGVTTHREAHGLMVRGAPLQKLVVMGEATMLVKSPAGADTRWGWVSMLQADFEAIRGLHLLATAEAVNEAMASAKASVGGWLSLWWFLLPHIDVRGDLVVRNVPTPSGTVRATTLLFQLHAFL